LSSGGGQSPHADKQRWHADQAVIPTAVVVHARRIVSRIDPSAPGAAVCSGRRTASVGIGCPPGFIESVHLAL
jgi:hypothetical protein